MKVKHVPVCIIVTMLGMNVLFSCGTGLDVPGAMNVQVCREGVNRSIPVEADPLQSAGRAPGDPVSRISPDNAIIAFTRIWYPTLDTVTEIMNDSENTTMSDFTAIADPEGISAGCLKVLDCEPDDPYVFDLNEGTTVDSDVMPVADTMYPGVIVETLYYEFVINDFTVRWYTMGDGTYQRKDTLIKTDSSVSGGTGGEFKFAYVSDTDGAVDFFDTRQTTGSGLDPLIRDEVWDDWDSGQGSSGLLPNGTHLVLHSSVDAIDENNSLYFKAGDAPEIIEYVITYSLSVDKGGVEYTEVVDADDDGEIEFSDLVNDSGSRDFDLIPITGAIEYTY